MYQDVYKSKDPDSSIDDRPLNAKFNEIEDTPQEYLSNHLCPVCQVPCYDLGKESGDIYCWPKHWYKCSQCGRVHPIIIR
jgi:hypothetical protein